MSKTPYNPNLLTPEVYGNRRPVLGKIIALLHITFDERKLELVSARSRGLRKYEIHELMVTDEITARPGGGVDRVSAIAFFEINEGGLVVVGDKISIGGRYLGKVAGYNMTHMPNHMNLLVKADSLEVDPLKIGEKIEIRKL